MGHIVAHDGGTVEAPRPRLLCLDLRPCAGPPIICSHGCRLVISAEIAAWPAMSAVAWAQINGRIPSMQWPLPPSIASFFIWWSGPLGPHSAGKAGSEELRVIAVEMKDSNPA